MCKKCVLEAFIRNSTRRFIGKIIESIHKQLGHSSIEITAIYLHSDPYHLKKAVTDLPFMRDSAAPQVYYVRADSTEEKRKLEEYREFWRANPAIRELSVEEMYAVFERSLASA